jgi:hypothetical protein
MSKSFNRNRRLMEIFHVHCEVHCGYICMAWPVPNPLFHQPSRDILEQPPLPERCQASSQFLIICTVVMMHRP